MGPIIDISLQLTLGTELADIIYVYITSLFLSLAPSLSLSVHISIYIYIYTHIIMLKKLLCLFEVGIVHAGSVHVAQSCMLAFGSLCCTRPVRAGAGRPVCVVCCVVFLRVGGRCCVRRHTSDIYIYIHVLCSA